MADALGIALIMVVVVAVGVVALVRQLTRPRHVIEENQQIRRLLDQVYMTVKDSKDIDPTAGLVYGLLQSAGYQAPALRKEDT